MDSLLNVHSYLCTCMRIKDKMASIDGTSVIIIIIIIIVVALLTYHHQMLQSVVVRVPIVHAYGPESEPIPPGTLLDEDGGFETASKR